MPATIAPPQGLTACGIELFKAGTRRDSAGNSRTWTVDDLEEMAEAYNSVAGSQHDAPAIAAVQVGHDGNIAYGWLSKVYRQGNTLLGDYRDVDPQFAERVNQGRFRKRSISLYPRDHGDNPTPGKWNIRHVAYVPVPACKGMKDHTFHDSGEGFIEISFEESTAPTTSTTSTTKRRKKSIEAFDFGEGVDKEQPIATMARLMQAQRDRMIEQEGVEEAEKAYPKALIEHLATEGRTPLVTVDELNRITEMFSSVQQQLFELQERCSRLEKPSPMYSETPERKEEPMTEPKPVESAVPATPPTPAVPATPAASPEPSSFTAFSELEARLNTQLAQFAELQTQVGSLSDQLAQKQNEIDALKAINATHAFNAERERIVNFVEGLVRDRKVLPTEKERKIAILMGLNNDAEVEFSEGASKTARQVVMDDWATGRELWSNSPMPTDFRSSPNSGSAIANFAAAEGYTLDTGAVEQHGRAVTYCEQKGWDWRDGEKYTAALIATAQ